MRTIVDDINEILFLIKALDETDLEELLKELKVKLSLTSGIRTEEDFNNQYNYNLLAMIAQIRRDIFYEEEYQRR